MSTAFLITFPLMVLAIGVAVAPVLVVSIREHRLLTGKRAPSPVSAPLGPVRASQSMIEHDADAKAAVVAMEDATAAVSRLRSRREGVTNIDVDESLRQTSYDLRRVLVSLDDLGR